MRHDAELKPIWDIQPLLDSLAALGASPPAKTAPAPAPAPAATTPRETNLDDADLIERARRAKNGAKFARLWAGDTSEHGGNDSSADLALCDLLAFWCGGDAARIDGLFRQSGLMRGKWDERRGELTYGERTIAVALKDRTEFYDPKPSRSRLPIPSTNGKAHDHGDQADEPQTAAQIIEQYIRERYRPVFRVGNSIHTDSGETIPMTVGVGVPNSGLIDRLARAINAPRFPDAAGGGVKHEQLPGLFRKWGSTAWGDLLDSLPEEDEAELGQDSPTAETFRRLVRDAMFTGVTLGDVIGHTNITQVERRSMISWCIRFATPGPWRSIRDYACWCQRRQSADGELVLRVAIRHEMFAQIKTDKRLTEMTATKWARRAARYGVGASAESDRPHGRKAVVLSAEFLAKITAGIPDVHDADICPTSEVADGPEMVGQDSGPSEGMQPSVTRILA